MRGGRRDTGGETGSLEPERGRYRQIEKEREIGRCRDENTETEQRKSSVKVTETEGGREPGRDSKLGRLRDKGQGETEQKPGRG